MCMDEMWMRKALEEAEKAAGQGEIPVGAVIVRNGEAIAYAHNEREQASRPTGHAEIIALERAAARLGETGRMHDLCHAGTLRDVRRRDHSGETGPRCLWRVRR